jgi:hypothetical protein
MKKFILGLFLFFSINGMAIHVHHFHHYSHPHHHSYVTTQTKKVQPHKVHTTKTRRIIRRHKTKVVNNFLHNGILYYVILHPKKGHVYDNGLVLCEGCNKVLVKKGVKYCSKCRKLRETKRTKL